MPNPRAEKLLEDVETYSERSPPLSKHSPMIFKLTDDEDDGPELDITGAAKGVDRAVTTETGIDLSDRKKIVFFVGRGKTGKTTGIRWVAEMAITSGRVMLMADMDPTNDSFSKYVAGVSRPSDPSDPALALKWLDRLLQHALQTKMSLLVDLGGGDTTLRRLAAQLPDLVNMFEAEGFAVIVCYTAGPQEEDLSPLATMMGLDFHPTGTAIVLNEALVDVGETRENAFARIFRHSAFRLAIGRRAVPVWMPRLLPAQQVEIRRLPFQDAAGGQTGQGNTPLGPFDRARVLTWLNAMDVNFAGIKSWLP
jgi:hypothetical protein